MLGSGFDLCVTSVWTERIITQKWLQQNSLTIKLCDLHLPFCFERFDLICFIVFCSEVIHNKTQLKSQKCHSGSVETDFGEENRIYFNKHLFGAQGVLECTVRLLPVAMKHSVEAHYCVSRTGLEGKCLSKVELGSTPHVSDMHRKFLIAAADGYRARFSAQHDNFRVT